MPKEHCHFKSPSSLQQSLDLFLISSIVCYPLLSFLSILNSLVSLLLRISFLHTFMNWSISVLAEQGYVGKMRVNYTGNDGA